MVNLGRILGAPAAAALFLSSCGGGTDMDSQPDRFAGPGVSIGAPAPGASPVPTEPFFSLARQEICAETRNRLFLIDGKQVFWDRAGNCGDNGYAQRLYGASPDELLCSATDSIAGPRINCNDPAARALFDTILGNLTSADLGLGSGRKVELLSLNPVHMEFRDLERSTRSLLAQPRNVVVRDAAAFEALWAEHAGGAMAPPQVDFARDMVIGVFLGARMNGCHATAIDSVVLKDGKITVARTDAEPGPGVMCTLAIVYPAHLVVLARSEAPVEFSSQVKVIR